MKKENVFPPLPTFIKVSFQTPNWSIFTFFKSFVHNVGYKEKIKLFLEKIYGKKHIYFYNSATSALFCLFKHIKNDKRKEVLIPSFMCNSVFRAIIQNDLKPIFVDIDSDFNMDISKIEKLISKKTLAILIPYYNGKLQDNYEKIIELSKKNTCYLINDLAMVGPEKKTSFDCDFTILSFNMGKNTFAFGGGILISKQKINSNLQKQNLRDFFKLFRDIFIKIKLKKLFTPIFNLAVKLNILIREDDITKRKSLKKIIPKTMSNMQAKLTHQSLKSFKSNQKIVQRLADIYHNELKNSKLITLPSKNNTYTKFVILTKYRYELSLFLKKYRIETQWTFYPLHLKFPEYSKKSNLSVSNSIWKETLSLPIDASLKNKDIKNISNIIKLWEKKVMKKE